MPMEEGEEEREGCNIEVYKEAGYYSPAHV